MTQRRKENLMGTDFGKYGYAPGLGEEIEVKRTLVERICSFLLGKAIAAEDRAELLQYARRIKMRNDLCEQRQKEREARRAKKKTVAIWRLGCTHTKGDVEKPVTAIVRLSESKTHRFADIDGLVDDYGSPVRIDKDLMDTMNRFIKAHESYQTYVEPWIEGRVPAKSLSRLAGVIMFGDPK